MSVKEMQRGIERAFKSKIMDFFTSSPGQSTTPAPTPPSSPVHTPSAQFEPMSSELVEDLLQVPSTCSELFREEETEHTPPEPVLSDESLDDHVNDWIAWDERERRLERIQKRLKSKKSSRDSASQRSQEIRKRILATRTDVKKNSKVKSSTHMRHKKLNKITEALAPHKKAIRRKPRKLTGRQLELLQKSNQTCIQKKPFNRLVREIAHDVQRLPSMNLRWEKKAFSIIQEVAEGYITSYLRAADIVGRQYGHVTLDSDAFAVIKKISAEIKF